MKQYFFYKINFLLFNQSYIVLLIDKALQAPCQFFQHLQHVNFSQKARTDKILCTRLKTLTFYLKLIDNFMVVTHLVLKSHLQRLT